MLEEPTSRLVARLKAGERFEESFETLFRRYHGRVYRSFPTWISPAVRSELTQEVFFKIFRRVEILPDENFERWLHRVVRRTFLSWYQCENRIKRKGTQIPWDKVQNGQPPADTVAAPAPSPLAEALSAEQQRVLRAAIEDLPPQMRSCILLRVEQDRTIDEVASLLGLASGTVKAHLHAARTRLKPMLAAYFSEIDVPDGEPP